MMENCWTITPLSLTVLYWPRISHLPAPSHQRKPNFHLIGCYASWFDEGNLVTLEGISPNWAIVWWFEVIGTEKAHTSWLLVIAGLLVCASPHRKWSQSKWFLGISSATLQCVTNHGFTDPSCISFRIRLRLKTGKEGCGPRLSIGTSTVGWTRFGLAWAIGNDIQ